MRVDQLNAIVIDFETRSECDLLLCGSDVYAKDPSTDILCLSLYDLNNGKKFVFDPCEEDIPKYWVRAIKLANLVIAHNAMFDREIWRIGVSEYNFPEVADEKWYCSSAQMRVNAIPASLADAAQALGVKNRKSFKGAHLIKKLSIPQEDGSFNECPKLMAEMKEYCLQDTVTTVDILRATRLMTATEHADWLLNERINATGITVDRHMAVLAQKYAYTEQRAIANKLKAITDGAIEKPTQHMRIKDYITDGLEITNADDMTLKAYMTKPDGKFTLNAKVRESIITLIDCGNLELQEEVEAVIRLLHDATATSVSKFKRMQHMAGVNDRVRGAFIYYGASQTGRFSSKGLQMHNLKRDCLDVDQYYNLKALMQSGGAVPHIMSTLSKALRPALLSGSGKTLVVGDWSAIEARALPWLAEAEAPLELFRNGVDVYVETAKDIGQSDRQVGKVANLSLGYGGATGAFQAMAINYGLKLDDHTVKRIVDNWRANNQWCVDFWREAELMALRAVRSKGIGDKEFRAGRLVYTFQPNLMGGTLICTLPDGSHIQYPKCRIIATRFGEAIECLKASVRPKADSAENWGMVRLWGGLMVENVTQAFCAGLLRNALRGCDESNLTVIGHVHDEIILECDIDQAVKVKNKLQKIMETTPAFAKGLPLKAVPVAMTRYGNH